MAVFAIDAAQVFDFEARARARIKKEQQLTIGIVGFGTFGQFLAKRMVQAGHRWGASGAGWWWVGWGLYEQAHGGVAAAGAR